MTASPVRWLFGCDDFHAVLNALGLRQGSSVGPGRLALADGRECWRAGACWLVGDPRDLAVYMPGPTTAPSHETP